MERNIVIIGAGLFGSVAARACLEEGWDVTVIDGRRNELPTGSKPSACLAKPGWLAGLGDAGRVGLDVMRGLYQMHDLSFKIGPVYAKVHWVRPADILWPDPLPLRVETVDQNGGIWVSGKLSAVRADAVLVAAGCWSGALLPCPPITPLGGASLIFKGEVEPEMYTWAPYRQQIRFNREPGEIWFGDGTVMKNEIVPTRLRMIEERAERWGLTQPLRTELGYRPQCGDGKIGHFAQVYPRVYVATGGAKSGMVLAGYHARMFVEAVKKL